MNFIEHNIKMLSSYTRDNGSKQLRIAQYDVNGNLCKVFKNRYQAARYLLDEKHVNYLHARGIGYTRSCVAGALTSSIVKSIIAYGFHWKILSPYDNSTKVTEHYVSGRIGYFKHNKYSRWLVFNQYGKPTPFISIQDISKEFGIKPYHIRKIINNGKRINGISIITKTMSPRELSFTSLTEASRVLRSDIKTIRKAIKESTLIHNYKIIINQ